MRYTLDSETKYPATSVMCQANSILALTAIIIVWYTWETYEIRYIWKSYDGKEFWNLQYNQVKEGHFYWIDCWGQRMYFEYH